MKAILELINNEIQYLKINDKIDSVGAATIENMLIKLRKSLQPAQPSEISDVEVRKAVDKVLFGIDYKYENRQHLSKPMYDIQVYISQLESKAKELDEENKLLKRDVANNKVIRKEAIRLGKNRLQKQLDEIREVIENKMPMCVADREAKIRQILDKEVK